MSKHDQVARRLARKEGVEYNKGQGPDVVGRYRVIEVETEATVRDGVRQLQGYRKPVYLAGTTRAAIEKALRVTEGTTVGVMDPDGNIMRRSTRSRS